MPIARKFLDWSRPALPAVVHALIADHTTDGLTDLSGLIIVLPGGRAQRRLLELLIERTDSRLIPPKIVTEGDFPELLYEPKQPFAGQLVQQLAWGEAVRQLPRPLAERVLRDVPDDGDVDGWMALGEMLWNLHRELAADQLDFGDVVEQGVHLPGFPERQRWEALHAAQTAYLDILDDHKLWDRQTARLFAIDHAECHTDREIVLVGTVDLNRTTRAMLDQVADRVTAFIHAPQSLASRFDEHGCLHPAAWNEVDVELRDDQLRVAEGPAEQADEVVRVLSSFGGKYRADDITIGLPDESVAPQLRRRLEQYDVAARSAVGKTLPQTGIYRLLEATADFLETNGAEQFAALVRHPDVDDWLRSQRIEDGWLTELDKYRAAHLPNQLGYWLGSSTRYEGIRRVYNHISTSLKTLHGPNRSLAEWTEPILQWPLLVLAGRELDAEKQADRAEIEAFKQLQLVLEEYADVPESLTLILSGAQAIRLLLEWLEDKTAPPPRDDTAVELLGWLELSLDDAPALIVTSLNEQFVPSSIDADLFLPNKLRQHLGLLDNDRRYARDCYALSAMQASRDSLTLIAARRDRRGDPLLPSRLVLACQPEIIARRIEAFFEPKFVPVPLAAFGGEFNVSPSQDSSGLIPPLPLRGEQTQFRMRVTAFRDYIACPYRFYLRHILHLEAVGDATDEMSPHHFGTLLHQVLEDFGRSERKNSTDSREIVELSNERLDVHAERQFGRRRGTAVNVQLEQMRSRLAAFADWQARRAGDGWMIAFVEEAAAEHTAELTVDTDRSLLLYGRIDRIDRHVDKGWAIFDYKTGESGDGPDKVHRKKGEWVDLQLPLYRLLASTVGVTGDVELGYLTLPRDSRTATAQIADWSENDLRSAETRATEIAREILDQKFLPISDLGGDDYDDFAAICQEGVFDRRSPG